MSTISKTIPEMNNQELILVLKGAGGKDARSKLMHMIQKSVNHFSRTGEKAKDLEQIVKWYLQGRFDLD